MGPHRPALIGQRVVCGVIGGQGPQTPASEEIRLYEACGEGFRTKWCR
jgi:hypothetical protein